MPAGPRVPIVNGKTAVAHVKDHTHTGIIADNIAVAVADRITISVADTVMGARGDVITIPSVGRGPTSAVLDRVTIIVSDRVGTARSPTSPRSSIGGLQERVATSAGDPDRHRAAAAAHYQ